MAVCIQPVLVDAARYFGTEFFQQPVTRSQCLMYPTPLSDVDADGQVTHP